MKKWIIAVVVIIAALVSASFVFVPNIIGIKNSVVINNNMQALYRTISDTQNWSSWWPGKIYGGNFLLNENTYTITDKPANSALITINNSSASVKSLFHFTPVAKDSVNLVWHAQIPTSYNPVKRWQIYFAAKGLQKDLDHILHSLKSYYSTTTSIYGIDIRRAHVKDSSLIFTSASFSAYPSTEEIYFLIDKLRGYITSQSAKAIDSPMLNIFRQDSISYVTKVAIPVNSELPSSGDIVYKWMLPKGNILYADVRGGAQKVENAFIQMENYIRDCSLTAPAIPYYSLITNRQAEKDSSKWITRIYYPVIFY